MPLPPSIRSRSRVRAPLVGDSIAPDSPFRFFVGADPRRDAILSADGLTVSPAGAVDEGVAPEGLDPDPTVDLGADNAPIPDDPKLLLAIQYGRAMLAAEIHAREIAALKAMRDGSHD